MLRAVSGFLLAPLLPPILIGAAIVLSDGTLEIVGDPFFLFVILYALLVSYAWALFLGLPAHLALRHFRRAKFWHYAFAGPISALPVILLFMDVILKEDGWLLAPNILAPALAFAAFWAIAVRPSRVTKTQSA